MRVTKISTFMEYRECQAGFNTLFIIIYGYLFYYAILITAYSFTPPRVVPLKKHFRTNKQISFPFRNQSLYSRTSAVNTLVSDTHQHFRNLRNQHRMVQGIPDVGK